MCSRPNTIDDLIQRGARIEAPATIQIGPEVDPARLAAKDVVIHAGCRIHGKDTYICRGAQIGQEGPATIHNCQIGPDAQLKAGFFQDAVFLAGASMGLGAHVRGGTILEEQASGAHCVGLKQTILFPFVTLGSLINFCDCLMSGGTSRKNHSEVGSSYIHFNFTPNQDKATASLIGDVPHGVMLDQPPIFLGGQGGLVGPSRIAFGTVIAAGSIWRKDQLSPGMLVFPAASRGGKMAMSSAFSGLTRIVKNNLLFIANLTALFKWYQWVRSRFVGPDFPQAMLDGLIKNVDCCLAERIRRLHDLVIRADQAASNGQDGPAVKLIQCRPRLDECFQQMRACDGDRDQRDRFLEIIAAGIRANGKNYLDVIRELAPHEREVGVNWLQNMVDDWVEQATALWS